MFLSTDQRRLINLKVNLRSDSFIKDGKIRHIHSESVKQLSRYKKYAQALFSTISIKNVFIDCFKSFTLRIQKNLYIYFYIYIYLYTHL